MKIEELKSVSNIDDLKKMGTVDEISSGISDIIAPLKIESKTYEDLFEVLQCLSQKWIDFKTDPFIDETAEYTFYLTMLDGKQRNKLLGITEEMYDSPELAKQWYRRISKLVHPDNGSGTSNKAFLVLKKLYEVIIDSNEDDINEK